MYVKQKIILYLIIYLLKLSYQNNTTIIVNNKIKLIIFSNIFLFSKYFCRSLSLAYIKWISIFCNNKNYLRI